MQDDEIIKRIRRGEKTLFGELADKYYDDVFRYCYYRTGDEQAAYDCTQETFLHLMRYLDSYTERRQFKAYLLRIALNVCRDYYRKSGRDPLSYEDLEELPGDASPEQPIEDRLLVQKGLSFLPGFQQEVIILYFYQGYKLREIAHITGVSLPTVKSRLRQGMDKLRIFFRKEGIWNDEKK